MDTNVNSYIANDRPVLSLRCSERIAQVSKIENNTFDDVVASMEAFSSNLQSRHDGKVYPVYVSYMVYKTIEANPNITINQIRRLLRQVFFIPPFAVNGAIASLVDKSIWGSVTRFQRNGDDLDKSHLHVKNLDEAQAFSKWLDRVISEYPELVIFTPPRLVKYKPEKKLIKDEPSIVGNREII